MPGARVNFSHLLEAAIMKKIIPELSAGLVAPSTQMMIGCIVLQLMLKGLLLVGGIATFQD